MIGTELEQLLRRVVREELAKLIGVEPEVIEDAADDELRQLAQQRAARLKARVR